MPPGGVKPHKKRVVSVQPNSRVTRSTKGVPPSEIPVTPASIPHVIQADENVIQTLIRTLIPSMKAGSTTNSIIGLPSLFALRFNDSTC